MCKKGKIFVPEYSVQFRAKNVHVTDTSTSLFQLPRTVNLSSTGDASRAFLLD